MEKNLTWSWDKPGGFFVKEPKVNRPQEEVQESDNLEVNNYYFS